MDSFEGAKQLFLEGLAALKRRALPEAESCFRRSLDLLPGRQSTLVNLAVALLGQKKYAELMTVAREIIATDEASADGWLSLGSAYAGVQDFQQALAATDRAITVDPKSVEAHYNRGNVLCAIRRYDEALESYGRALAYRPDYADAYNNRGIVFKSLGRSQEALRDYDQAIALDPRNAEAHYNRGETLRGIKHYLAAVQSFDRALEIQPDYPFLRGTRLYTRMHACAWEGFDDELAQLEALVEAGLPASAPFSMTALSRNARLQRVAAERWARDKVWPSAAAVRPAPPHNRIRVGYFSADFREHPVSWLTAELFERHDRSRFEVYAFSFGPNDGSAMRQRLAAAFEAFIDVRALSDSEIVDRSRKAGIDIAIDLSGYTDGGRSGVFAARAAPVQAAYIGYLGTLGAPFMDYLIADDILIPQADRQHYAEKIAYLPFYQANDTRRPIADKTFTREALGLPAQGFVFCCFSQNYKITPPTFDGWMRILRRVEGSVLLLYADNLEAAANLKAEARRRGVDDRRLIFGAHLPRPEYLARYRAAGLFLDTQPYNAGTTASDALWAGLPVLTQLGTSFAGRVAASVLRAAGLPELIAATQQDYEDLAVVLATDTRKLGVIRQKIAAQRATMPLFDSASFTRHLETLYGQMHQRLQAGLAPDHLYA